MTSGRHRCRITPLPGRVAIAAVQEGRCREKSQKKPLGADIGKLKEEDSTKFLLSSNCVDSVPTIVYFTSIAKQKAASVSQKAVSVSLTNRPPHPKICATMCNHQKNKCSILKMGKREVAPGLQMSFSMVAAAKRGSIALLQP